MRDEPRRTNDFMIPEPEANKSGRPTDVGSGTLVRCEVWSVQQLAAGGRWNTLLAENNQSDAERAVERLAKSGERNLRIQVTRAPNEKS